MTTSRSPFDGYKSYPGCTHKPQVILETLGMKACTPCAYDYMTGIGFLVEGFRIIDGELNAQAKTYLLTRTASTPRLVAPSPEQEGGVSGDKPNGVQG